MSLSANLRNLRAAKGETVEDLAAATRVPAATIRSVEDGRVRTVDWILEALAAHYGLSPAILRE
jgi:transcriptional regulator with XRE-family HTH domain